MILGDSCTRHCKFCAVLKKKYAAPDPSEPGRIAEAVAKLGLQHVVITSVTRDDLSDGGAGHFVETIAAVHQRVPQVSVEVLTPDFSGKEELWEKLLHSPLAVFNHNVETVPRLYAHIRPQAEYGRSLRMLRFFKDRSPFAIKSGIMVGLGETRDEVQEVLHDLKDHGCSIVTIGQYIRPSKQQLEVVEYVEPRVFEEYRSYGTALGLTVFAGPWVRSSYCAGELLQELNRSRSVMP